MLKPGYPLTLTIWVKVAYPFKQNSQISQNFAFSVQINAPAWKNKFTTAGGGQTWDLSKNLHIVFWRNLHKWQKFLHDRRSQQISTLVVAVVTIMGCGDEQSTDLEIVSLCFVVKAQRQLTKMLKKIWWWPIYRSSTHRDQKAAQTAQEFAARNSHLPCESFPSIWIIWSVLFGTVQHFYCFFL